MLLFPALFSDWVFRLSWINARRWRTAAVMGVTTILIAGSAWWSLHTTFVRYPREHFYSARDYIVRLALDLGEVRRIANFDEPEEFDHEAYRALIPHIERTNVCGWAIHFDSPEEFIKSFGTRTLIVLPIDNAALAELCQEMGAERTGLVTAHNGIDGFRWCYVERNR